MRIVQFNNDVIDHSGDLPERVADIAGTRQHREDHPQGQPMMLTVMGAAREQNVAQKGGNSDAGGRLGLAVRQLTAEREARQRHRCRPVVEDVSGPAARVGIQPGDVILSLNGTPITSADQLRSLVAKSGKQVALLVQRDDASSFRSTLADPATIR